MTMTSFDEKAKEAQAAAQNLLMERVDKHEQKTIDSIESFSSTSDSEDEDARHTWSKKTEYILAAVGYCVGLGNIWRFPYVCMRNGGGAFLIPFFLSLIICALPMYFMETAIGQFNGKSAFHVWDICPLFKGVGTSMNIVSFFLAWYFSIILGWSLIYVVNSCKSPLPWVRCDMPWNTANCIDPHGNRATVGYGLEANLSATANETVETLQEMFLGNGTMPYGNGTTTDTNNTVSSTHEFWVRNVLERSSGIDEIGGLPWHTSVALIAANFVVLIGVVQGIRSTGKVVYITATLPYLLLTVMIILGMTLPGAMDGVIFYLKPDFSKLMNGQTWVDAFIQVFYSLGPGWGGLITMGSYNKFKNNCMRDSVFLTLACEGTSIYGGFAIFTILGHMAYTSGKEIKDFASSGAGLAFIVYPTAISYLPLPQLWGVLFFLMLFTLGLDTQFTCVETLLTSIADTWPKFVGKWRKTISIVFMTICSLMGLIFATRGGFYLFILIDWYIGAFSLMTQAILECIVVAHIYGADRFARDIELMIGSKPPKIWIWAWKYIAPTILTVVQIVILITFKPPVYDNYSYSRLAEAFGWFIAVVPVSSIFIGAILQILRSEGSFVQRIQACCKPGPSWGPADPVLREKYHYDMDDAPDRKEKDLSLCCSVV